MKRLSLVGLLALALCGFLTAPVSAAPIVVTFDDLVGNGPMVDGYGGINWDNNWFYYDSSQPPYNPESNPTRLYPNYGIHQSGVPGELEFSFPTPQEFLGAYFSGYDFNEVYFNLYYQGNLVHTSASLFPTGVPTFLSSGYTGPVDRVGVYNSQVGFAVMDNVTYQAAITPEPATMVVFGGLAIAGLAGYRRRKMA